MPDVVIVGGGVIGCATAMFLAEQGASVTVLERGELAGEASGAAAGMLAALSDEGGNRGPAFQSLCLDSLSLFQELLPRLEATGVDLRYRATGVLHLAMTEDEAEELRLRYQDQRELAPEEALSRFVRGVVELKQVFLDAGSQAAMDQAIRHARADNFYKAMQCMRRILPYSIVNQVGFMVTGIGIGTEMALNGAAAHAFTHILYKALLLMSAGSVLYVTGRRKCTDLGGLYHSMPLTAACGIIGALAITAFPLTSGFVSKSMISQAAGDEHLFVVWMLLAAATAGVFLHAGIKFPWFVFFQKDSGLRPPEPPWNMRAAMLLFSAICIGLGIFYEPLYGLLPYAVDYVPYTAWHVVAQLQLLLFSGLAFFVMLGWLRRTLEGIALGGRAEGICRVADHYWVPVWISLMEARSGNGRPAGDHLDPVGSPTTYLPHTVSRRSPERGVSPRGWMRSSGLATIAARLRCVAQPLLVQPVLFGSRPMSSDQSGQSGGEATNWR